MATITERIAQDGSKSYRVEVRLKGSPRISETFTRLTDARRWASATETAIREGRHFGTVEAKRRTLGEAIDRYIRDILPTKEASPARDQLRQVAWWKKRLGAKTLFEITPDLLILADNAALILPSRGSQTPWRSLWTGLTPVSLWVMGGTLAALTAITTVPWLANAFRFGPLSPLHWFMALLAGLLLTVVFAANKRWLQPSAPALHPSPA